ncbi:MAG: tetratricopeptide repeat protein [Cyanobacteria bacterium P01_A01_bin.116]
MRFFIIVPSSLIVLAIIAVIGAGQGNFEPQELYPAPENGEEFLRRGELYEEAGEYEKALADYEQAEALIPDDSNVYLGQGASFSALDQPAAAVEKYLIVKEIDQRNGRSTYIIDDLIEREREKL